MRVLGLVFVAVALAAPVPAGSMDATGYLAPRDRAAVSTAGLEEAPSDVEPPVDWRRGVGGTDETDHPERSPQ